LALQVRLSRCRRHRRRDAPLLVAATQRQADRFRPARDGLWPLVLLGVNLHIH